MASTTSVIIPVRNGANYIAEAVGSVLSQLTAADNVFIVDDASIDHTRAVLSKIDDQRIAVLEGSGRGPAAARNVGLRAARGDFVAFLDHDDVWPAGRHAVLLKTLTARPDYDAAFGRIKVLLESNAPPPTQAENLEGQHLARFTVWTGLYRKSILDRVGEFAEDMPVSEDTDFAFRLVEIGMRWCVCDAVTLLHRRHGANLSNAMADIRAGQVEAIARRIARARARGAIN